MKAGVFFWPDNFKRQRSQLTQHLTDVRFNIYILQVLVGVRMVQTKCAVQSDGHPNPVSKPSQLTNLALTSRMGIKWLLIMMKTEVEWCHFVWGNTLIEWNSRTYHNLESFGVQNVNFVCVATPNVLVPNNTHAAHRMIRLTKVDDMVIGQIPLTICQEQVTWSIYNIKICTASYMMYENVLTLCSVEHSNITICQGHKDSAFDVTVKEMRHH